MTFDPKHLLVPVAIDPDDDFRLAEHALFAACDIAEKFSAKITLLHLAPVLSPGGGASVEARSERHPRQARGARGHAAGGPQRVGAAIPSQRVARPTPGLTEHAGCSLFGSDVEPVVTVGSTGGCAALRFGRS